MLNHECFFFFFFSLHICCFAASNELNFCVKSEIFECTRFIRLIPFFRFSRYCSIQLNILAGGWCFQECVKVKYSLCLYIFSSSPSLSLKFKFGFFSLLLFIRRREKCSGNYFITSDAHIGFIWWLHMYVYVNWHLSHDIGFSLVAQ